jgi:hypothetical protein
MTRMPSAYARRRAIRRRRRALGVAALAVAAIAFVLASGGGPTRRTSPAPQPSAAAAPRPAPRPAAPARRVPPPGTLPQTRQFPAADTPRFHAAMSALWQGIVTGSTDRAMPAFFPEAAYAQVKAIQSPRADWVGRLVHGYALDLAAAHALLGPAAAGAQLVRVDVPSQYGHWVPPGTCYNGVGYYEVPNARVVYRAGAQVRSLGIASMISWRGEWYVVHLGAVSQSGVVDDPEVGPGTPVASGTC